MIINSRASSKHGGKVYFSVVLKGPFLDLRFSEQVVEIGMENLGVLWYTAIEDNKWAFAEKYTFPPRLEEALELIINIQDDHVQILHRDNGETKNIILIDKKDIHNNKLQVINQYSEDSGSYKNRYDVTILVNGLPLIHIELKRRGVAIREAFNQINRYQRDSFWAGRGLYEYVHLSAKTPIYGNMAFS